MLEANPLFDEEKQWQTSWDLEIICGFIFSNFILMTSIIMIVANNKCLLSVRYCSKCLTCHYTLFSQKFCVIRFYNRRERWGDLLEITQPESSDGKFQNRRNFWLEHWLLTPLYLGEHFSKRWQGRTVQWLSFLLRSNYGAYIECLHICKMWLIFPI